jgi:hypothetical protein
VWSRIDDQKLKATSISHRKLKLNDIAKALNLEHALQDKGYCLAGWG